MVFSKQPYYVKLRKEMTLRAAPQVKTKKMPITLKINTLFRNPGNRKSVLFRLKWAS